MATLAGGDVRDGEEGVEVGRRGLLERVLGHDVELAGQLVGVELRQIGVERQAVAGQAAAHDGGVGGEERGHRGGVLAQVEAARGGHPLVEVGRHLVRRRAEVLGVGGDHLTGHPAEEHRLDVVPLARDRVDVVLLPELLENFILGGDLRREVDQRHDGLALDLPAAHAHADALAVERLAPCAQQVGILGELGIGALVREVGTDEHVAVAEFGHGRLGLGGHDRVDAAHLVTYLPAHLEEEAGGQICIRHICLSVCNLRSFTIRIGPQR